MNLPTYRPSRGGWPAPSAQLPIQRRAIAMQLQASKMFYQWAEVTDACHARHNWRIFTNLLPNNCLHNLTMLLSLVDKVFNGSICVEKSLLRRTI
jgi:hypothetical protein